MAITFGITKNKEWYIDKEESKYVFFFDEETSFIVELSNDKIIDLKVLLDLDPYGDQILNSQQVQALMDDCNVLIKHIHSSKGNLQEIHEGTLKNAKKLLDLCKLAIAKTELILAIGD